MQNKQMFNNVKFSIWSKNWHNHRFGSHGDILKEKGLNVNQMCAKQND